MNISIPIGGVILFIIILINCCLGLSKRKIFYTTHLVITTCLTIYGFVESNMIRTTLNQKLFSLQLNGRLDESFVTWAWDKFRWYSVTTIIITAIILIICGCMYFRAAKNLEHKAMYALGYIVTIYRILLILFAIYYSYHTINNRFDLANYIIKLTIAECLALYYPLLNKKIFIWKKYFKSNGNKNGEKNDNDTKNNINR